MFIPLSQVLTTLCNRPISLIVVSDPRSSYSLNNIEESYIHCVYIIHCIEYTQCMVTLLYYLRRSNDKFHIHLLIRLNEKLVRKKGATHNVAKSLIVDTSHWVDRSDYSSVYVCICSYSGTTLIENYHF